MQYILSEEEYQTLKEKATQVDREMLSSKARRLILKLAKHTCIYYAARKEPGFDPLNPNDFDFDYAGPYCDACPISKEDLHCGKQMHHSK